MNLATRIMSCEFSPWMVVVVFINVSANIGYYSVCARKRL
jgi:hypothetical protein